MSGGYWDYAGFKIQDLLETIANDSEVKRRWPQLSASLRNLGVSIQVIEHEIDWDLCSDRMIEDDRTFERLALNSLNSAIERYVTEEDKE